MKKAPTVSRILSNASSRRSKSPLRKNNLRRTFETEDDQPLSPEWIKELNRRVRDLDDPVRYMLVSEFTRRFILYYDVSSDSFVMNEPAEGTLFKRREAAESVKKLLGNGVSVVKFTMKDGRLKRLSPYRGPRFKTRSKNA